MDVPTVLSLAAKNRKSNERESRVDEEPVAPVKEKAGPGRPPTHTAIVRPIKKYSRIDTELDKQLKLVGVNQGFDSQDIIYAAIKDFMNKFYKDGCLSEEGRGMVEEAIR